jgi:hypothetical protein
VEDPGRPSGRRARGTRWVATSDAAGGPAVGGSCREDSAPSRSRFRSPPEVSQLQVLVPPMLWMLEINLKLILVQASLMMEPLGAIMSPNFNTGCT